MPRRLSAAEERKLLAAAERLARAERDVERLRTGRDALVLQLVDDGCRQVDIADTLQLTPVGVRKLLARARRG